MSIRAELDPFVLPNGAGRKTHARLALEHCRTTFGGKRFFNAASGHVIEVTHAGIKHSIHASYDALLRVHACLDQVIRQAQAPSRHADKANRPDFVAVYKFPFEFVDEVDGKVYRCQMVTREHRGAKGIPTMAFYDLNVIVG